MSRPDSPPTPPLRERSRQHSWARVFIPVALILVWLVGASLGGPLFGKIDEVSSNEQTTYLPESAQATEVQQLLGEFNDSDSIPAIAVFTSEDELTQSELDAISDAVAEASTVEGVGEDVSPALPSDDGQAVQAFIPIDSDAELADTTTALGDELRAAVPDGISVYITGPAGFSADLVAGFAGIDGLLLGVATPGGAGHPGTRLPLVPAALWSCSRRACSRSAWRSSWCGGWRSSRCCFSAARRRESSSSS